MPLHLTTTSPTKTREKKQKEAENFCEWSRRKKEPGIDEHIRIGSTLGPNFIGAWQASVCVAAPGNF